MRNEVSQNLGRLIGKLPSNLSDGMIRACKTVQTHARENAPHDTGNLRRSIDFEVSDGGREGTVFTNCEYAPYVEYGTGIYATKGGEERNPGLTRVRTAGQRQKETKPNPSSNPQSTKAEATY